MIGRWRCALVLVAPALFVSARAAAHAGHGPTAAPSSQALALAAAQPTPFLRGKAFYEIGAMDRAEKELSAALAADPRWVAALRYRAMVHAHERRFPAAFADFEAALRLKPAPAEHVEVLFYYGDAYFNAGIYDQAAARFEDLLRLKPDHVDGRCYLGEALAKLGRREDALAAFRKALDVDPNSAWAHHSMADVLVGLGRDEEALSEYRADLRLVAHCQTARVGLARALVRLGRLDEAGREYYQSLGYHLGDADAHNGMGQIFLAKREYARALAEFARTLEYNPGNEEARRGLEEARRLLERSVSGIGAELTFWRAVGWWAPAAIVAAAFLIRRQRERRG